MGLLLGRKLGSCLFEVVIESFCFVMAVCFQVAIYF